MELDPKGATSTMAASYNFRTRFPIVVFGVGMAAFSGGALTRDTVMSLSHDRLAAKVVAVDGASGQPGTGIVILAYVVEGMTRRANLPAFVLDNPTAGETVELYVDGAEAIPAPSSNWRGRMLAALVMGLLMISSLLM
jgi:hypothetical protein